MLIVIRQCVPLDRANPRRPLPGGLVAVIRAQPRAEQRGLDGGPGADGTGRVSYGKPPLLFARPTRLRSRTHPNRAACGEQTSLSTVRA